MDDEEQAILDHFNDLFAVKVNEHIKSKIHILQEIYDRFAGILSSPNKRYLRLQHKDIDITNQLLATLNEEQKKIFEEHLTTIYKMCALEGKQLFFFGYILTTMLDKERNMSSD